MGHKQTTKMAYFRASVYARHLEPQHTAAVCTGWETDPTKSIIRWKGDGGRFKATTIPKAFMSKVRAMGDLNALNTKREKTDSTWTSWTWSQYYEEAAAVAKALLALGFGQHDVVNILAFNCPEWFFAAIGAIFAGGMAAGIYITNSAPAVEYILDHSKCKFVFVDNQDQLDKVMAVRGNCPKLQKIVILPFGNATSTDPMVLTWDAFLSVGQEMDVSLQQRMTEQTPGNACYLSYTSGTTGQPKAVMYSHDNVLWAFHELNLGIAQNQPEGKTFGLEEKRVSYLPLSHIAGNFDLLGPIAHPDGLNAAIYFAFPDALQGSIVQTLTEVRPTMFLGVPRVYEKFEAATRGMEGKVPKEKMLGMIGMDQVKWGTVGAAPIAPTTLNWFEELGLPINEIYGMTENVAFATMSYPGKRKVGSVGIPTLAPSTKDSELCLYESTNEICTRSRATMMGYMYNPEKTAEAIDSEGWLHTGDIGNIDEQGFVKIVGRIKEMIITAGGENMAPVLIEDILKKELPAISNVMMVGERQKYLIALMTLKLEPDAADPRGFNNCLTAEAAAVDPNVKTVEDTLQSKVWMDYLNSGIERANEKIISRAQNVRKYVVLPHDFSASPALAETAELTPTLKLKRDIAHKNNADVIKSTYGDDYVEMMVMGSPL